MFKKRTLIGIFAWIVSINSLQAIMDSQVVIFSDCNAEIIRDAESLQKVFAYIMNQLDQQGTGSISVNYTEAGYTLLQALQKGGYLNLCIENKENKACLSWVIKQKPKSIKSLLNSVKNYLGASVYTN